MMKKFLALTLALTTAFSLAACGGGSDADATGGDAEAENRVIKVGVVGENVEHWDPIIEAVASEGITLELVKFSDYTLPNQATADGDVDLNGFQHHAFLENEVEERGLELSVIAETFIAPLGLYSDKITDISELKDGDKIAIPSDATNGGRSLKILESAGLITVDPAAGYTPELADVTGNPLNIEFIQVEAAQTPSLLPDVAAAIINGGHAVDHDLFPATDAIYLESGTEGGNNPYVNILVARTAEKDDPDYAKIIEAYHTEAVAEVLANQYKGAYIPAWK